MEGEGGCWTGEKKERFKERMTLLRIAWVPFISPCSERKGKTFGLRDTCFGEHVAPLFGVPGSALEDLAGLERWTEAVLGFCRL